MLATSFVVACNLPKKRGDSNDAAPTISQKDAVAISLADAGAIDQAIAAAAPLLLSQTEEQRSEGTSALVVWSATHLKWKDLAVAKDETNYLMFAKDPNAARGKRLCRTGTIRDIIGMHTGNGGLDGGPGELSAGVLDTVEGNQEALYQFTGIRSSGQIVRGSSARFCGFIVGSARVSDKDETKMALAVELIGMFDLPENHKP